MNSEENVPNMEIEDNNNESQDVHLDNNETKTVHLDNNESQDVHLDNNETKTVHLDNNETKTVHLDNNESQDVHLDNNETKTVHLDNNESQDVHLDNNETKTAHTENKKTKIIPKFILENQKKYMENLDKKNKLTPKKENEKRSMEVTSTINKSNKAMRRVNIAGKVKFLPIDENNKTENTVETKKEQIENSENEEKTSNKKSEIKQRIPNRYLKFIESEIKKETLRNVKNFSDLRRITIIQDLNPNVEIDTTKASINELIKIRNKQRRLKNETKENKVEDSEIQKILNNDKLSKLAKTIAIKNLSVNSRNKKSINLNI
jgi:hypothetical protein